MKFRLKVVLAAMLCSAVPIALAQDAATDVKKGAEKTGHETKVVAKDTAKGKIQEADARHARERVSVIDQAVGVRGLRDVDMVIEVRPRANLLSFISVRSTSTCARRPPRSTNADRGGSPGQTAYCL